MNILIDKWKDTDKHNFAVEFIKYFIDITQHIQIDGQVIKIYGEVVDKLYINFNEKHLIIKNNGGCGYYKIVVEKELSDFIKINRNKKLKQLGI